MTPELEQLLSRLEELNDGLFPCPFCGSDQVDPDGGLCKPFPVCGNCGASAESTAAWNTRNPSLIAALREAVTALEDCRKNWDCDKDSHRYGTTCRACMAEATLSTIETLLKKC